MILRSWGSKPMFYLVAFTIVLQSFGANSLLDSFKLGRKACFEVDACLTMLKRNKLFGCGQCSPKSVSEPVIEFDGIAELVNFLLDESQIRRVIMVPEQLFFRFDTLTILPFAEQVSAVVVYPGFSNINPANKDPVSKFSWDEKTPNVDFSVPSGRRPFPYNDQTEQPVFGYMPFGVFHVATATRDHISAISNVIETSTKNKNNNAREELIGRRSTDRFRPRFAVEIQGNTLTCPSDATARDDIPASFGPQNLPAGSAVEKTSVCLENHTCLPIGGHSVWSSVGSMPVEAIQKTGVLAITAPMDSRAFFPTLAQGASAEMSSLAALLAVSEAIANYRRARAAFERLDVTGVSVHPVFFVWTAQAYGFSGSSRFLQDLREFECQMPGNVTNLNPGCDDPYMPSLKFQDFRGINFTVLNIASLVDPVSDAEEKAGVVTTKREGPLFFLHGTRTSTGDILNSTSSKLQRALKNAFNSDISDGRNAVPPDASQSFAQYMPDADSTSISNYQSVFTNQFYHSQFDNITRLPLESRYPVVSAATGITRAIIQVAYEDQNATIEANMGTINGVLDCFMANWTEKPCALAEEFLGKEIYSIASQSVTASNYAGVFVPLKSARDLTPNEYFKQLFVSTFLAYHNRIDFADQHGHVLQVECNLPRDCTEFSRTVNAGATNASQFKNVFCARGICIASDTYSHNAFGTGLRATNREQSEFRVDETPVSREAPEAPQFVQSLSSSEGYSLCGLAEDSDEFGYLILGIGCLLFAISLLVVSCVNRSLDLENIK